MPGEFEPQRRVWVSRPDNPDTWPGPAALERAQAQHAAWVDAMREVVEVAVVQDLVAEARPEDAWIRDWGPVFVVDDRGGLGAHDFRFNSWGGKYPPWARMDAGAARVLDFVEKQHPGLRRWRHGLFLEGGAFSVNGRGSVLTTAACLLDAERNPGETRASVERLFAECFGAPGVVWLGEGIRGDDTDGHVDDCAQFVSEDAVLALEAPAGHRDHDALSENLETLRAHGGFDVHTLPSVDPGFFYDAATGRLGQDPAAGELVPASHANFLISNGSLFLPVFGCASDDAALAAADRAAPELRIVPVRAEWLVVGLGALHCLSQQEPAAGG
ncbi:agmatine deiminase family protein [Phycisphaera mikurensis]|nr:agmatine deiminase family protein [Phycisphaera mikurensis]MBB6441685.1 agmatine deiminase [Phycisphaera mikurensis]